MHSVCTVAQKTGRRPVLIKKVPDVLQGSAATHDRCGGMFIADLLLSLMVIEF